MRLGYILAIVAAGIVVGIFEPGRFQYALGHATLYVFLPPLLFEAAWNLHYRAIVRQWPAIATLAGPGVAVTAIVVAVSLVIVRVPFGPALLAGAILSATDPIAVVAVFRRLKVPRTLATIVECESLFNDAVAVVLYRAVLAGIAVGAASAAQIGTIALVAVAASAGGIVLGCAGAYLAARLMRPSFGARLQIAVTLCGAYGTYFAADRLGLSGIFATIAFGIGMRYFERSSLTLRVAGDVERFWDVLAVASNAVVFFLVGAALQVGSVGREPAFIIACIVAIAVARVVVAGMLLPAGYPRSWLDVVRIAGMRGALSLALALSLPPDVPYRQAIVDATFAVAIATLAAGGLTVTGIVRRTARELGRS